jgi:hypothetical protein
MHVSEKSGIVPERFATHLRIPPAQPDGLPIFVIADKRRATLALGSWYDDFTNLRGMLWMIDRAMDGGVRLRIDFANANPIRWAIEAYVDGSWREKNVMEAVFWRRPDIPIVSHYMRNAPQP